MSPAPSPCPPTPSARGKVPLPAPRRALRQLHASGQVFPARFELFSMIDDYLRILSGKDVALPEGYHAVVAEAGAVRAALARNPAPLAPCHCDPLCENFLDTGETMWIVDWEYSGMNDPMWDWATCRSRAGSTQRKTPRCWRLTSTARPRPTPAPAW